jgi:hypothetical protein
MIAGTVRTYGTDLVIRYHTALPAVLDIISQIDYSLSEMMDIFLRLLKKVKRKTHGTTPAHSGKRTDCINCIFQQF